MIIDCNTHLPYYWSSLVSQDFCNNGRFNIDIDQRYIFPGIGKDGIQKLRIWFSHCSYGGIIWFPRVHRRLGPKQFLSSKSCWKIHKICCIQHNSYNVHYIIHSGKRNLILTLPDLVLRILDIVCTVLVDVLESLRSFGWFDLADILELLGFPLGNVVKSRSFKILSSVFWLSRMLNPENIFRQPSLNSSDSSLSWLFKL